MIGKLVFFLIIAALVYWLLKIRFSDDDDYADKKDTVEDATENADNAENDGQPKALEEMVRCAHCGVHLPRSESVVSQGKFFCCNEHRLEYQKVDTSV